MTKSKRNKLKNNNCEWGKSEKGQFLKTKLKKYNSGKEESEKGEF